MNFLEHKLDKDTAKYESIRTVFGSHSRPFYDDIKEDFDVKTIERNKPKKLPDIDKEHKEMVEHHSNYSDNDIHHIKNYTDSSYDLNRHLYNRGNKGEDPHHDHHEVFGTSKTHFSDHIHGMDAVVNRHKTHKPMNVYTGIHKEHNLFDTARIQHAHEGKPIKVIHHGYTSTSLDRDTSRGFAHNAGLHTYEEEKDGVIHKHEHYHQHILKIHVPKGHPGAYVAHHSRHPSEKEFILPRGTKLHIHHKPKKETTTTIFNHSNHIDHIHSHAYIWHARIKKD